MALKTLMQRKIKIKLRYVQRSLLSHTATKTVKFFKIVVKVVLWTFCFTNSTLPTKWVGKNILALSLFLLNERNEWEKNTKEKTIIDFFFGLTIIDLN